MTHKFDHITPVRILLHWLPVKFRIDFKILLYNKAPEYIFYLITVCESPCNFRSLAHDSVLLVEPKTRLVSYGDRAFSKAAPMLWNHVNSNVIWQQICQ